jgi:hypothetical protein
MSVISTQLENDKGEIFCSCLVTIGLALAVNMINTFHTCELLASLLCLEKTLKLSVCCFGQTVSNKLNIPLN